MTMNKLLKQGVMAAILAVASAFLLSSCEEEPEVVTPDIYTSSSFLNFSGDGGNKTVTLYATGKWNAESDSLWVTSDPASGSSWANVTVKVEPNPNPTGREANIEFRLKDSSLSCSLRIIQAAKGSTPGGGDPVVEEEDNSSLVIPKSAFTEPSPWGLTGTICGLEWNSDIAMLGEPEYGWVAAFDVEINSGEEFKFRKDGDWKINLGGGAGWPAIDKKYVLADDGKNLKAPAAGKYDLYINPSFMLLYMLKAGETFTHGDAVPAQSAGENTRIYILNISDWTNPYLYAYAGSGALQPLGAWPGTYAAGTKVIGDYTWTYWEASGFQGVGAVNLIINNNGEKQYPLDGETEALWKDLTILTTLYFVWDGKTVTQIENPEEPGVTETGTEPDKMEFGSSSWTIIGTLGGTNWDYDFPMDTEGYWEVAREVSIAAGEQFKFRQNRKWQNNLGHGEYSETGATAVSVNSKIELSSGAGNMTVSTTGEYDIYLSVERKVAYLLPAGSEWTHESDGKPDYVVGGKYGELTAAGKKSGITYQVNVFSFKDSDGDGYGDFRGLIESMDYFNSLGVTALWLSPVQPAQSYHGYDVIDYEKLYSRFGTEKDFQDLISVAHENNIRIYMDYVMNHSGDQNIWFMDVKDNGKKSPYWDYYSLSKDPASDVAKGLIAQVPSSYGYNQYKWFPVTVGGGGMSRYKIELDWTNSSAPTMTVSETDEPVTTGGTYSNPARYLYWGNGTYSQFADNGTNKYTLVLNYQSSWGCLVRTTKQDVWTGFTKWGFNKTGDQMELGKPHTLYSDDNPDNVQTIIMPGGELYYYYTEFGTGMFVDFNYGKAESCADSPAFKAIMHSAEKWIKMGVDGFRLDAVKHIYANETGPENKIFWNTFYEECNKLYKQNASARTGLSGLVDSDIFMVGEVLSGDGDCTPFYSGLPALFEFQFWWDLRECLNGESIYNAGYGKTFPVAIVDRWNNHIAARGSRAPEAISTPKLANHDEDRTASTLGNYKPKIRQAAAVLLTTSGRPYIYQGEELGYWGTKAGGDEFVRTPILWDTNTSSAASKGVSNKVDWEMLKPSISVAAQSEDDTSLLTLYRHFGYARSVNPALANGWPEADSADNADGKIAGWYLHAMDGSGKEVLVLHNFSGHEVKSYRFPGQNVTNQSILVSNGHVSVSGSVSQGTVVTLPAYSSVVFELN